MPSRSEKNTSSANFDLLSEYVKAQTVIPMVGAGLSKPYGFPLWREFLEKEANTEHMKQEVQKLLNEGKYEEAADYIFSSRQDDAFTQEIATVFTIKNFQIPHPHTTAVSYLPEIFSGPVLTVNYDHVLERVYELKGQRFSKIYTAPISIPTEITRAIGQFRHVLIKIHGNADDQTRILTRSEYDRHYLVEGTNKIGFTEKMLPSALACAFTKRNILFLGCSLQSDRFLEIMKEIHQKGFSAFDRHFAMLARPQQNSIDAETNRLAQYGILPIWYEPGRHDQITDNLKKLGRYITKPVQSSKILDSESNSRNDSNHSTPTPVTHKITSTLEIACNQQKNLLSHIRESAGAFSNNRIPREHEVVKYQEREITIEYQEDALRINCWPKLVSPIDHSIANPIWPLNRNRLSQKENYVWPADSDLDARCYDFEISSGTNDVQVLFTDRDRICKLQIEIKLNLKSRS